MATFLIEMSVPTTATFTREIEADTLEEALTTARSDPFSGEWQFGDYDLSLDPDTRDYHEIED